ncbi:hypothetical protein HUJ04_011606, partial [Dendroctonus ponderosae]
MWWQRVSTYPVNTDIPEVIECLPESRNKYKGYIFQDCGNMGGYMRRLNTAEFQSLLIGNDRMTKAVLLVIFMSVENLLAQLNNLSINPSVDSDSTSLPNQKLSTRKSNNNNINKISNFNKSLKMLLKPECLNCVPTFDGNPTELNRYLAIWESIISNFYDATNPNNFQNVYLLNSLIGKLTGNARLVINIQAVSTWAEVKELLNRNFADKRDESCLNRDLVMLKQLPHETAQKFYDKCLELLNLLCSVSTRAEQQMRPNLNQNQFQHKFSTGPVSIRPNRNYRPPRPFTNSHVFGKTPVQQNVFNPDPNHQFSKPTPM